MNQLSGEMDMINWRLWFTDTRFIFDFNSSRDSAF